MYHHHDTSHTSLHHHLQHHDNVDPIHDVNDPHDVSATSDLATSCYGYRYRRRFTVFGETVKL
jgi:hypothetical protein